MLHIQLQAEMISSCLAGSVVFCPAEPIEIKELSLDIVGEEKTKLRKTVRYTMHHHNSMHNHNHNRTKTVTIRETNLFLNRIAVPGYPVDPHTVSINTLLIFTPLIVPRVQ